MECPRRSSIVSEPIEFGRSARRGATTDMSKTPKRSLSPIIEEHFATDLNGGDWTADPWFLQFPSIPLPWGRQFSHAQLVAAAEQLKHVFTPRRCRQMFSGDGHNARLCLALFVH